MILREIPSDTAKSSRETLLLMTIFLDEPNPYLMIFMLHLDSKMLLSCRATLLPRVSKKVQHGFILNLGGNLKQSRWRAFTLVRILSYSLLDVNSHSIKHII